MAAFPPAVVRACMRELLGPLEARRIEWALLYWIEAIVWFFSGHRIRIRDGAVRAWGRFRPHRKRIALQLQEWGLDQGEIRFQAGKLTFSAEIPRDKHQRLRNFLYSECLRRLPKA